MYCFFFLISIYIYIHFHLHIYTHTHFFMHHKDTLKVGTHRPLPSPFVTGYNGNLYASLVSDPDLITEATGEMEHQKKWETRTTKKNPGEYWLVCFFFPDALYGTKHMETYVNG